MYDALGQKQQALEYYGQALAIRKEVGDRAGEGMTLHNIGMIYASFGQVDVALACVLCQVPISVDTPARGNTEDCLQEMKQKLIFLLFNWRASFTPQ